MALVLIALFGCNALVYVLTKAGMPATTTGSL